MIGEYEEMMIFKFDIEPQPQDRPRIGYKKSWNNKTSRYEKIPTLHDTTRTHEYKQTLCALAHYSKKAKKYTIPEGALRVSFTFVKEPPTSWSATKKHKAYTGEIRPESKPDLSNYVKSAEDALNTILWHDDNVIVEGENKKLYGEKPYVLVEIDKV